MYTFTFVELLINVHLYVFSSHGRQYFSAYVRKKKTIDVYEHQIIDQKLVSMMCSVKENNNSHCENTTNFSLVLSSSTEEMFQDYEVTYTVRNGLIS